MEHNNDNYYRYYKHVVKLFKMIMRSKFNICALQLYIEMWVTEQV